MKIVRKGVVPNIIRDGQTAATLDRKDFVLLRALEQDATRGLNTLARMVGLSASSVHERLRRLRRLGVIRAWTVQVDAPSVGLGVLAFVAVDASRPCSAIASQIVAIDAVEECHSIAGQLSMLLKVRAATPADLLDVTDRLRKIPGVERTETTMVLKTQMERGVMGALPALG